MATILIDPVVIIPPRHGAGKSAVATWFTNLDLWLREALTTPHTWLHSLPASNELRIQGQFPDFEMLRRLAQNYQLYDVEIKRISKNLNQYFNNEEHDAEAVFMDAGVMVEADDQSLTILPAELAERWPVPIALLMRPILALICASQYRGDDLARQLSIVTLKFGGGDRRPIEISAVIVSSIPDYDWKSAGRISATFPVLFAPDDLPLPQNVAELWHMGEAGVRFAIRELYRADWQGTAGDPLDYALGARFLASVRLHRLSGDDLCRKLTRVCAAVLANRAHDLNYDLRHLRETDAPGSSQRVRPQDGARAWRLTITKEGVGWRMHYWKRVDASGNEVVEFANVLKKHDPEEIL